MTLCRFKRLAELAEMIIFPDDGWISQCQRHIYGSILDRERKVEP
jgi:hypothetical protein